ncbi:LysR family transcriptional regulator [Gluconacetobacter azotocaptans]|uniref:LysR substrate-binding domain-containing protein n=1 Tax=Gluconacetobacter azotocaptans TaxID=142834 RepID=UPI0019599D1A|nr:LysR family transcriptional regulator [Gluconacetobacter azotocaptans]MBM9401045.1 LysR family transcriptional regulator [Gluconacetobacter azotocaptans]
MLDQSTLYQYLASGRLSLVSLTQALVVSEQLSFHKASDILGVTQSAISNRVASLEDAIGFPLFERQRSVRLTPHGRIFLEFISDAIDLVGKSLEISGAPIEIHRPTVRVALQSAAAAGPLAAILRRFDAAQPDIGLTLMETDDSDVLKCVRRRKLDMAFLPCRAMTERLSHDVLDALPLWDEQVVVALNQDDPLAAKSRLHWKDLVDREFLVRSHGIGPHLMDLALPLVRQVGEPGHIEHLRLGRDTLLTEVVRRRAAALTTEATLGIALPALTFRPIGETPVLVTFCALWSRQNINPSLRSLLKIIRELSDAYRNNRPDGSI